MRVLLAMLVAGCTSSSAPSFTYHATASWDPSSAPQVSSVTIDGQLLAVGDTYDVMQKFESYEMAVAAFTPREVVVAVPSGVQRFTIAPGYCDKLPPHPAVTFAAEDDMYSALSVTADGSVDFAPYCGECITPKDTYAWCARAE